MAKLEVGDRVRVYRGHGSFIGRVDNIALVSGAVFVIEDGFYSVHNDAPFHAKQCRKLAKRKLVWIHGTTVSLKPRPSESGWVPFIEVKHK